MHQSRCTKAYAPTHSCVRGLASLLVRKRIDLFQGTIFVHFSLVNDVFVRVKTTELEGVVTQVDSRVFLIDPKLPPIAAIRDLIGSECVRQHCCTNEQILNEVLHLKASLRSSSPPRSMPASVLNFAHLKHGGPPERLRQESMKKKGD